MCLVERQSLDTAYIACGQRHFNGPQFRIQASSVVGGSSLLFSVWIHGINLGRPPANRASLTNSSLIHFVGNPMPYDIAPTTERLLCEIRDLARFVEELTDSINEIRAQLMRLEEQFGIKDFRVREYPVSREHRPGCNKPN